jgi:hypothetical protein
MGPFLLGFLISGLIGITLVYNCYSKREITEKKLRQNINNLEHNMEMQRQEFELRIEQAHIDLKKCKEENKKSLTTIDIMQKKMNILTEQFEECKQRLEE